MKTNLSGKLKQSASTLVVTLFILCVLATGVAAYLSLAGQQNRLSTRSQSWNMAVAVVEAGIEEAMQQLNKNTVNLAADGWTYDGRTYSISRTLPEGSAYAVKIDPSFDPFHPTITCLANVPSSALSWNQSPFFCAAVTLNSSAGSLSRAVRVQCGRGNLLIKGMVAKHLIDMSGNNILTDSFNSTDPASSNAGRYNPAKARDNGDVATNDRIANSLTFGNANIYGHVITGPGGSVALNQGAVGTHAWQPSHPGQIQPGYFSDNANFTFPDQVLPYTTGLPPTSGTVVLTNYVINTNAIVGTNVFPSPMPPGGVQTNTTWITTTTWPNKPGTTTNYNTSWYKNQLNPPAPGTYIPPYTYNANSKYSYWHIDSIQNYTYPYYTYNYGLYTTDAVYMTNYYDNILTSGDYAVSTLSGKTVVLGNARLVVTGGISMSGNDVVHIAQNGSLEMYVDGSTSTIGGNGIVNLNGYAVNCRAYFTPNVTSLNFNGNGEFIGVVVAPSAHIDMNGGGHSYNDFIGAIMAESIKMNGKYGFHYDEALGAYSSNGRYIINSWDEIDPSAY